MQLVGEMELERREIERPDGTKKEQLSTVHIKKCRYLEQSGCVGMCVNMCKARCLLVGSGASSAAVPCNNVRAGFVCFAIGHFSSCLTNHSFSPT